MGQALYRKYRSKSFGDVVGQDHITNTLQNALKSGRISHAYLFTGPKGVGKTSVARILAHEVNSLSYTDEAIHLDIIEIDAASNRRIDEIRELRDRVRIAPTSSKYKVYIIDEVHMLTREAFNALLKTLEEPPAHCIFILATTEAHKLPETIISRTQRFEFKPVNKAQMVEHLGDIAKQEKIKIEPDALELLAEFGSGSFRDSISYLDQLSSLGKLITQEEVRGLLGLPPAQDIDKLLGVLGSGDTAELLTRLKDLELKGVSPAAVAAALSAKLRQRALSNEIQSWQVKLLQELLGVSAGSRPQETLEIVLLNSAAYLIGQKSVEPARKPSDETPAKKEPLKVSVAEAQVAEVKDDTIAENYADFSLELWDEVVSRSKSQAASIYTALRLAKPSYEHGTIILNFRFPLHQKKMDQTKNKHLVSKLIEEVYGSRLRIESVVDASAKSDGLMSMVKSSATADAINNIFGDTEVIEA